MADADGSTSAAQGAAPTDGRRIVIIATAALAVVVLLVLASGAGVLRDFRAGSVDRSSELIRAAVGASIGLLVGGAVTVRLRRARAGAVTGAMVGAVLAIAASVGVTAAVATTPIGPPEVAGPSTSAPPLGPPPTIRTPDVTLPPITDGGVRLPDWLGIVLLILLAAAVLAAVLFLLAQLRLPRIRRGGRTHPLDTTIAGEIDLDEAADSFDESAGVIDDDPDPRKAIIAAYAHLLERLDAVGFPRLRHEAPEEHLGRTLAALGIDRIAMETVTANFLVARFSTHPLTELDREVVRDALRSAAAQLRPLEPEQQPAGAEQPT